MKPRTLVVFGLVILTSSSLAVLLAYVSRWQLAIFSIIPMLSGLLGVVLALMALVTLWRTKIQNTLGANRIGKALLLTSVFLMSQLVYCSVAPTFRDVEAKRTQEFLALLIPKLEDYKRQHDTYPEKIDAILSADMAFPPLLQLNDTSRATWNNRNFYTRRETTYSFQFYLPDGFIGFQYEYCCGPNGRWTVTD